MKGPKTVFNPKSPPARTVLLTKFAQQVLDSAAARAGASRSDVVELLLRQHGGRLTPVDFAPVESER